MVFITGAYGLGENVVQGAVDPDEFYVHKPTFRQGYRGRCCARKLGRQGGAAWSTRRGSRGAATRQRADAPKADRQRFCLDDDEVLALAGAAIDDRGPLHAAGRPARRRWTSSGPRTAATVSSTSCRRGPKRWPRAARRHGRRDYRLEARAPCWSTGRAVGEKIAHGRPGAS